jgi:hypothetical protein
MYNKFNNYHDSTYVHFIWSSINIKTSFFVVCHLCCLSHLICVYLNSGDHRSRDRVVVGFYNYLCNRCLSPLKLWVRTPLKRGVLNATLCDKVCQWLATGQWFSSGTPVSFTNKTDCHDITETLLKVVLNTITLTPVWGIIWSIALIIYSR